MSKVFVVLYVALVAAPDSKQIKPVVQMAPSYIHCLQAIDAPKNPKFTFVHQECKVVEIPLPRIKDTTPVEEKVD